MAEVFQNGIGVVDTECTTQPQAGNGRGTAQHAATVTAELGDKIPQAPLDDSQHALAPGTDTCRGGGHGADLVAVEVGLLAGIQALNP